MCLAPNDAQLSTVIPLKSESSAPTRPQSARKAENSCSSLTKFDAFHAVGPSLNLMCSLLVLASTQCKVERTSYHCKDKLVCVRNGHYRGVANRQGCRCFDGQQACCEQDRQVECPSHSLLGFCYPLATCSPRSKPASSLLLQFVKLHGWQSAGLHCSSCHRATGKPVLPESWKCGVSGNKGEPNLDLVEGWQ